MHWPEKVRRLELRHVTSPFTGAALYPLRDFKPILLRLTRVCGLLIFAYRRVPLHQKYREICRGKWVAVRILRVETRFPNNQLS